MKTIAQLDCCLSDLTDRVDVLTTNNVVTDATTARTLSLSDAGKYIRFTNAGSITLTVPTDVPFPIGTVVVARRETGAGAITLAGATVNDDDSAAVAAGKTFAIKKVSADEWDFI